MHQPGVPANLVRSGDANSPIQSTYTEILSERFRNPKSTSGQLSQQPQQQRSQSRRHKKQTKVQYFSRGSDHSSYCCGDNDNSNWMAAPAVIWRLSIPPTCSLLIVTGAAHPNVTRARILAVYLLTCCAPKRPSPSVCALIETPSRCGSCFRRVRLCTPHSSVRASHC